MTDFYVEGPFEVPWTQKAQGRSVNTDELPRFWDEVIGSDLQQTRGCYAFGMRAGQGITPIYIGKATKNFRQECFAPHKLLKINGSLLDWKRGTPVLFLIPFILKGGRVNMRLIAVAEKFLIENAVARNNELANVHGTKREEWGIKGAFRGGQGKPSEAAMLFKKMMGLP